MLKTRKKLKKRNSRLKIIWAVFSTHLHPHRLQNQKFLFFCCILLFYNFYKNSIKLKKSRKETELANANLNANVLSDRLKNAMSDMIEKSRVPDMSSSSELLEERADSSRGKETPVSMQSLNSLNQAVKKTNIQPQVSAPLPPPIIKSDTQLDEDSKSAPSSFLDEIASFNAKKLKKAATVDKSVVSVGNQPSPSLNAGSMNKPVNLSRNQIASQLNLLFQPSAMLNKPLKPVLNTSDQSNSAEQSNKRVPPMIPPRPNSSMLNTNSALQTPKSASTQNLTRPTVFPKPTLSQNQIDRISQNNIQPMISKSSNQIGNNNKSEFF